MAKKRRQSRKKKATVNSNKRRTALRPMTVGKIPTVGRKVRKKR